MLPREFLTGIAKDYGLSQEQTDVFLEKFSTKKSDAVIAAELHISPKTVDSRMGEVYEKFNFKRKGPGKAFQLLSFLMEQYLKANPSGSLSSNAAEDNLGSVVQAVRSQRYDKIQNQCGTLRMLNVTQQISLTSLYTNVYVLEDIPSQQWGDVTDWIGSLNAKAIDPNKFERFGLLSQQQQPPKLGLEAVNDYQKLMVLGAPGSGKTTFLQYIAIQANQEDQSLSSRVPIFIRLRDFAEAEDAKAEGQYSLLNYISQEFEDCGISEQAILERLLTYGKVLMLLDGLDEVPGVDGDQVVKQARKFIRRYHKNQFIITCRTQSHKYRFQSDGFN